MIDWILFGKNVWILVSLGYGFLILIVALIFQIRMSRSYFEAYSRACERAAHLAEKIDQLYEENKHLDIYTCFKCDFQKCPYRWDYYNTRGDCLDEK